MALFHWPAAGRQRSRSGCSSRDPSTLTETGEPETITGSGGSFRRAGIMADDVIFVREGERLVSRAVAPYEAEAVLQELLEHHPQLLAGYEMSRSDPRRFLLVCREAPVADQGGAGRWSLDHLFVDQ